MAEARHICLVTPGHLSTNPRLVKEADALHEAGFRVTVVAARFMPWADEADREFDRRPWPVHRVRFGPLAPTAVRLVQSLSRRTQAALWRAFGSRDGGRLAEGALHPTARALSRLTMSIAADLHIAHNLAALPAAGRAAVQHGSRLGFDAEDFHLGQAADGVEGESERRLVRAIEGRWLPRCTHLTAASPGIAQSLAAAYSLPEPAVVLNVFPLAEAPATPEDPSVAPGPGIYWFSQTIGPHRGLESALLAVARAKSSPHIYLRGRPAAGYRELLENLALEAGAANRLHFLPPMPPSELVREAARFHVGLACETGATQNSRICLTNKMFTYLLAGLPMLASATPAQTVLADALGEAAEIVDWNRVDEIAARLDAWLLDAERLKRARRHAWALGRARYCWDVEKLELVRSVKAVLA